MKDKRIICPCIDVTAREVIEALEAGSTDIRDIRMRSGAGSGICRGKYCIHHVIKLMADYLDKSPAEIGKPTQRPPVVDVTLGEIRRGSDV